VTGSAVEEELLALYRAGDVLGLDTSGAQLVSSTSRFIWHLPGLRLAVLISRPGTKNPADVQAEVAAVRAALAADVRTPRLVSAPVELADNRTVLVYDWIASRPFASDDWPDTARELARLAEAGTDGLAVLKWPDELPDERWRDVLGPELHAEFAVRCRAAATTIRDLTTDCGALVLCHGDVQPANVLVDPSGSPWLIDFEYACLAPREWDPAKVAILGQRFGDPQDVPDVLSAWPDIDLAQLSTCIDAQETLLVAWLARMALSGTVGAAAEARRRALSLSDRNLPWHHLS
jgi:Ser/Thr protein kinase RdoA (MazF antagonist)